MEKIVNAIVVILNNHNGKCSNKLLLKELRLYDEYIDQNELERLLREYSILFKRIPEIEDSNGKVVFEEEIELVGDRK